MHGECNSTTFLATKSVALILSSIFGVLLKAICLAPLVCSFVSFAVSLDAFLFIFIVDLVDADIFPIFVLWAPAFKNFNNNLPLLGSELGACSAWLLVVNCKILVQAKSFFIEYSSV